MERRAPADLALDPDPTSMQLDDLARDRKAEPGARDLRSVVALEALVAAEHLAEELLRDSRSLIADRDMHRVALEPARQPDVPAPRRVLDRVAEQV